MSLSFTIATLPSVNQNRKTSSVEGVFLLSSKHEGLGSQGLRVLHQAVAVEDLRFLAVGREQGLNFGRQVKVSPKFQPISFCTLRP